MSDEDALAALEALYEQLPSVDCQGMCWNSCGPIEMSQVEARRIEERGIVLEPFTSDRSARWDAGEPLHCPALKWHRCSVYDVRPFICRVWGAGRGSLACPWGCTITGGKRLRAPEVLQLLLRTYQIGGNPDALGSLDLDSTDVLLNDERVGPLMVRFVNGDRSVTAELQMAFLDAAKRLGLDV